MRPIITLVLLLTASAPGTAQEFFVSPRGKDSNSGTLESPFRTLPRARTAVRSVKFYEKPGSGITV